jgi:hypothetical protein
MRTAPQSRQSSSFGIYHEIAFRQPNAADALVITVR